MGNGNTRKITFAILTLLLLAASCFAAQTTYYATCANPEWSDKCNLGYLDEKIKPGVGGTLPCAYTDTLPAGSTVTSVNVIGYARSIPVGTTLNVAWGSTQIGSFPGVASSVGCSASSPFAYSLNSPQYAVGGPNTVTISKSGTTKGGIVGGSNVGWGAGQHIKVEVTYTVGGSSGACGAIVPDSGRCVPDYVATPIPGGCAALTGSGEACCKEANCKWQGSACVSDGSGGAEIYCDNLDNNEIACNIFDGVSGCYWLEMAQTCGVPGSSPGGTCEPTLPNSDPASVTCTQVPNKACCELATDCKWNSAKFKCEHTSGQSNGKGDILCSQFDENEKGCERFPYSSCHFDREGGLPPEECSNVWDSCAGLNWCCEGLECKKDPVYNFDDYCCIPDGSELQCIVGSQCCSGICNQHMCEPAACDVVPTISSYTDVTLDPENKVISVFTYNLSEKDYVKTALPSALIFMVNLTKKDEIKLCYSATDANGRMPFPYNPEAPGCTDYWFIFCPLGNAATNLASREKCLESTGLSDTLLVPNTPVCLGATAPTGIKTYSDHILSHNELYFCNQVPKDYAPLCWPLMLILGLLLGANFAVGRNPFAAFDLSSPRMNRGRQYSMRVQNKSFDFLSYVMGAATAAMSAKSMGKALKGGSFGKFMKSELKAANPFGGVKGLKSGFNTLARADGTLTKAEANLSKALKSGDPKSIAKAQKAYNKARANFTSALATVSNSSAASNPEVKKIIDAAKAELTASSQRILALQSPAAATFYPGSQPGASSQQAGMSPTAAQQVNMSVKGMIQGSRKSIARDMRKADKAARKAPEQSRSSFRAEKKAARTAANNTVASLRESYGKATDPAKKEELKSQLDRAKAEHFRLGNWQYGDSKPELDKLWQSRSDLRQVRQEQVSEKRAVLRAIRTGSDVDSEGASATGVAATGTQRSESKKDNIRTARAEVAQARQIGKMPAMGTSGAMASAYGARDTIGTLVSLFRKDTWNKAGRENQLAASGANEYFEYAANANSMGQALGMLLQFALKKMMEKAKLRDREKQEGYGVQTNISFRSVNKAVSSLFRIYSVMSVLSAYTKGLGAATGSRALKGGIGFMETLNSTSFGSIGKYNLNPAALASWVDPSLSQQMVGGGLPYPFNYLQGAVGGAVTGGGLLVQKFSDIFRRKTSMVMADEKNGKAYQIEAKLDANNKVVKENGQIQYQVANIFAISDSGEAKSTGGTGSVRQDGGRLIIKLENGEEVDVNGLKRNYIVEKKEGTLFAMSERGAIQYDRSQADRAAIYKNSNEFINQRYWFAKGRTRNYEIIKKKESGQALSEEEQKYYNKKLAKHYEDHKKYRDSFLNKMGPLSLEEQKQYDELSKKDRIDSIMRGGDKYVARQSKMNAYDLLSKLSDVSKLSGNEQMQVIGLRDALEKHIDFANSTIDFIRCTEASQEALSLIREKQSRDVLVKQIEKDKIDLQEYGKALSEESRSEMFSLGENIRKHENALQLYDAFSSSGLDMQKDVLPYAAQMTKANNIIAQNMMRSLDFSDKYMQCYATSIAFGMESRMPDIASFSGAGPDALEGKAGVLKKMMDTMSSLAQVRFKDKQSSQSYRASVEKAIDAGAKYASSMTVDAQKSYADALEKSNETLLGALKFDGRFAGTQLEIQQNLDAAQKQRAEHTDELGKYINYLTDTNSAIVGLHQTSDSYLSAQMAKTGWQDRAPYMSSPEADALKSMVTQETRAHVQGERPSLETGFSSALWFGSYSNALYMKGAEFKVPEVSWTNEAGYSLKQTKLERIDIAKQYSYDINETAKADKKDDAKVKGFQKKFKVFNKEPSDENLKALKEMHDEVTQPLSSVEIRVPEASMSQIRTLGKTHVLNLQNKINSGEVPKEQEEKVQEAITDFKKSKTTNNFFNLSVYAMLFSTQDKLNDK